MSDIVIEIAIVILLIAINGFFAMSELAVVSSRRARLAEMAERGSRGAKAALRLADDPGSFLSAVQVGITLVGILAGAFSGATLGAKLAEWLGQFPAIARFAGSLGFTAVVITVTYVTLIAGELVPKRVALNNAEAIAAVVARPMRLLSVAAAPIVWFLRVSTETTMRLLRLPVERQVTVTEEEVKSLIAEGTEAGVFAEAERDMITGVMRLADRSVRTVMTPRVDVVWLNPMDDAAAIQQQIQESGHSRYPVSRQGIDGIDGIIETKHLVSQLLGGQPLDLTACMRAPLYVHEGTSVLKLLELLRQSPVHIAFVVDEYGTFQGIVTPTDILAAIAGEFPEAEGAVDLSIVRREDGSWLFDGMVSIEDVERELECRGMKSEEHDYYTLAGFVLWQLGHVPQTGEHFLWQDFRFEVVDMDGRRIDRVLIDRLTPSG
jgi:putative hemolysin